MSLATTQHFKQWLVRKLGPNHSAPAHVAAAALTAGQYAAFAIKSKRPKPQLTAESAALLECVAREGYCVVPGFYSRAQCQRCISELERLFAMYPRYIQRRSDLRMFGVESGSPLLAAFADEPQLLAMAESVLREPTVNAFTLGSRIDYAPGNKGSGEGWHRDSFVVQFKALLYLSDVRPGEGPFQLLRGSEKLPRLMQDMLQAHLGLAQSRLQDEQVRRLLRQRPDRLRTFVAPAGTLLLVNTSAIHRGQPLVQGTRYALTNYFVPRRRLGPALDAHFEPVLRLGRASREAAA